MNDLFEDLKNILILNEDEINFINELNADEIENKENHI